MTVPYPLAGTTNSAVRAGVVSVTGGNVKWMKIDGDPREHYIARLQWIDAKSLLVQQLNRLQNTDQYLLIDAKTGASRHLWTDHDDAFIPIGFDGLPKALSIRKGGEFLVMTERDGWMHVYRINHDGKESIVTRGAIDVVAFSGVDEQSGSAYFIASPQNATQRYLYRAPLDGSSDPVRVTPAMFVGTNNYSTSPDRKYAFHAFSSFDDPGIRELVSLPDHRVLRTLGTSEQVKAKMKDILDPPVEYFQVDAGKGVRVDGYMIKPYGFDASKKYPVLVYDQGTELLVNRLVDLGKPFDFMTYPDRTHAISEGPGTTVHLYRLLTRYLTEHLPAGAK